MSWKYRIAKGQRKMMQRWCKEHGVEFTIIKRPWQCSHSYDFVAHDFNISPHPGLRYVEVEWQGEATSEVGMVVAFLRMQSIYDKCAIRLVYSMLAYKEKVHGNS
jgi:hypothetical protein